MSDDVFTLRPGTILALEHGAASYLARAGGRITRADASVFAARPPKEPRSKKLPKIALIEISGFIAPGVPDWLGTDPHAARAAVREARMKGVIDGVALLVDSPGGSVRGIEELFEEVLVTRDWKPTAALVLGIAASAAYHISSAAGRIYATPSGELGSIGVFALHASMAGALEKDGIEVSLIQSKVSPYKTEGHPFQPLGDEARAHYQAEVDRLAGRFVGDVARGRGITRDAVAQVFGRGRSVDAREAVARGMADEIATPEDALPRLIESDGSPRAGAALDRPLERGLTARQEMQLAEFRKEEAWRQDTLRRLRDSA